MAGRGGKVTILQHGVKLGRAGGNGGKRGDRAAIVGWSAASARANADILKSVVLPHGPVAISGTLTVGAEIPNFQSWQAIRAGFIDNLRKGGFGHVIAWHWLTEFQQRGAPHLHVFLLVPPGSQAPSRIESYWLWKTVHTGSKSRGQRIELVNSAVGWARYLGKHGARSVEHYQRSELPPGWDVTGRLWGKGGDWQVVADEFDVPARDFFALRRWLHRYLVAVARIDLLRLCQKLGPDHGRVRSLRRAFVRLRKRLRHHDKNVSSVRGLNDWTESDAAKRIVAEFGLVSRADDVRRLLVAADAGSLAGRAICAAGLDRDARGVAHV